MPFTIGQILDLLMVIVLIMFIPIGLWRGVLREWVALAGITLGLLLADEWAGPWGGDLAVQTGLDQKMAPFFVGAAFFLGTTLLIGYGGGAALPYRPDLTWSNRLLGALLGVGNGVLVLSGTLRLMQRHLFDQQSDSLLLGTALSRFLIEYVGWAQLVLLLALALCVVISLLRRWSGGPPLMEEFAPGYLAAYPARDDLPEEAWQIDPPAVAWEDSAQTDTDVEPAAVARAQQDTAVLHLVPPPPAARPVPPPPATVAPAAPQPRATTLVSVPRVVEIARPLRAAPTTPADPADSAAMAAGHVNGHALESGEPSAPQPADNHALAKNGTPYPAPTEITTVGLTCPVCANAVAARSRFCHHCGHIIGEAERRRVARQD